MNDHALLTKVYRAFNARDIDTVLDAMHPEVDWPNGWEGGRVHGKDAVRDYWTRQWAAIDPVVTPVAFAEEPSGAVVVNVHAIIRALDGALIADHRVEHVYAFEDRLIRRMDIRAS